MMDKVTLNKVWPLFLPAVLLLPLLFVTIPVAATPGQVTNPSTFEVNGKTNITISNGPSAPHAGEQIAVWNPAATPTFSVGCNLPGDSGGIKWELRADTDAAGLGDRADFLDATSARVSYNIPAGALGSNKLILEFGDGGTVPIYFTGTTTISPFFADPADPVNGIDNDGDGFVDEPNPARYAWIDLSGGVLTPPPGPGTDNTAATGLYKFASCGREGPTSPPQARYVGTTTFTVEQACKWCNKGAVLSQVTQNLGNCCAIPDIVVDVRQGTFDDSEHDNDCATVDPDKVGTADPATCLIQSAIDYINNISLWNTEDPTPGDGENFVGVTAQDCTDTVCEQNNSEGVCQNCENNTATDPARPPNGDGFESFVVTNPYEDVRLNIFGCSIDIFEPNNILVANSISPVVTIKDSVGKVTILDIHVHGSSVGYLIENNADLVIVKNSRAIGGIDDDAIGSLVNGDTIGYLVNDDDVEITGSPEISGWDIGIQLNGNDNTLRTNNDIINNGIGIQINGNMNESNDNDVGKDGEPNGVGIEVTGDSNDLHGDNVSHNTGDGIQIKGDFNMVEDEDAQENGEDGIDVSGNGNKIIKNKQVKMNGSDGIEVSGGNDPNELEENVVEDNVGNGINVTGTGNLLKKNEAIDNGLNGIEITGDDNVLEENQADDNDGHGMVADGTVAPNPSGNGFEDNDARDNGGQGIRACSQIDNGGNTGEDNAVNPQVDFVCVVAGPPVFFVVDENDDKVYMYDTIGLLAGSFDLDSDNGNPFGIDAVEGSTDVYVLDQSDKQVYKYDEAGTLLDTSRVLKTPAGSNLGSNIRGLEIVGDDMWVVDDSGTIMYRYSLLAAFTGSGDINAAQEINFISANGSAEGLASDGTSLYVLDDQDDKLYKYPCGGGTGVASKTLKTSSGGDLNDPTGATINATSTLFVVDEDSDTTYKYSLSSLFPDSANQNASLEFLLDTENVHAEGIAIASSSAGSCQASVGSAVFFVADEDDTRVYKYDAEGDFAGSFALHSDNDNPHGVAVLGSDVYVLDRNDDMVYRYDATTGAYEATSLDLEQLSPAGNDLNAPSGLSVNATHLHIVDDGNTEILVYSLASAFSGSGSLNAVQEIDLTSGVGNGSAEGLAISGGFFYVLDDADDRFYRYATSGGAGIQCRLLQDTGSNNIGTGSGATAGASLFVVDLTDDTLYTYSFTNICTAPVSNDHNASSEFALVSENQDPRGV